MSNYTVCEVPQSSSQQLDVLILTLVCAGLTLLAQLLKLPVGIQPVLDLFRQNPKAPVNRVLQKVEEIHAAVTPPTSGSTSQA